MEGGYGFLLDLALILLSTKLLGLLTQRFQLPQVVGALLAGLILGPAVLNVIQETEFIKDTAEIGVIVMMFCAGMETDVNELKHSGKAGFLVALLGVIVPLILGTGLAMAAGRAGMIATTGFLEDVFIGTILTATSVSITVETLKEIGKLDTKAGIVQCLIQRIVLGVVDVLGTGFALGVAARKLSKHCVIVPVGIKLCLEDRHLVGNTQNVGKHPPSGMYQQEPHLLVT